MVFEGTGASFGAVSVASEPFSFVFFFLGGVERPGFESVREGLGSLVLGKFLPVDGFFHTGKGKKKNHQLEEGCRERTRQ